MSIYIRLLNQLNEKSNFYCPSLSTIVQTDLAQLVYMRCLTMQANRMFLLETTLLTEIVKSWTKVSIKTIRKSTVKQKDLGSLASSMINLRWDVEGKALCYLKQSLFRKQKMPKIIVDARIHLFCLSHLTKECPYEVGLEVSVIGLRYTYTQMIG